MEALCQSNELAKLISEAPVDSLGLGGILAEESAGLQDLDHKCELVWEIPLSPEGVPLRCIFVSFRCCSLRAEGPLCVASRVGKGSKNPIAKLP